MPRRTDSARAGRGLLVLVASALLAASTVSACSPEPRVPEVMAIETLDSGDGGVQTIGSERSAVQVSAAMFESAPVVIVSGTDASALTAASAAVALGIPMLRPPASGADGDALERELGRLGTTTVLTVGRVGGVASGERRILPIGDAAAIATAFDLDLERPDRDRTAIESIAGLEPHGAAILGTADPAVPTPSTVDLPAIRPGRVRDDTVAVVDLDSADVAAAATARAAGAEVLVVPAGIDDPLTSAGVVDALAASAPASVLVIGDRLGTDASAGWKVQVATGDARLPSGGVRWFPDHVLVALYGVPGSGSLGVLGEQDAGASVARARAVAAEYDPLTDATVVPTFEIITTVASGGAGADGDFSNEVPVETIIPWVQAAADAGMQVILDLQPGRTDFLTQARRYEELLLNPNVGLALDPEWRLAPDQVPLGQIGSVDAAEVNAVIAWLADLTRDNALPQKPLVLHQFRSSMIGNRAALDTSRAEVAVLIHADGQGAQPDKQATWNALREDAPAGLWWGWKNFYDEDTPPLSPAETMSLVVPAPSMISYQ